MRRALAVRRAGGGEMAMSYLLLLEAEALAEAGLVTEALATLGESEAVMDRNAERFWVPEVYRLKGEILRARGQAGAMAAEDCFLRALDVARCQGALTLELRVTTSLARLWRAQGNGEEARQMLEGVLARVTEGFDTRDVMEARALLGRDGHA
jgi:predicted ATPase